MAFRLRILSPGKTKKKYLQEGIAEYLKRLSHYVPIEWIPVTARLQKQNLPIERILDKEAEAFTKYLKSGHFLIVLDAKGKMRSSEDFAEFLRIKRDAGVPGIDFLIGGEWGISEKIKNRADEFLSLSRMTFTHDLTRLILLEQIYRAFTIIKNENYHK
ncbi:MAG: 23S rRNA (pseudouridine(1915)-N(3))-methyltransferase RlmH [Calditrichaeota bacterium]|nr:23S rRNA (pseudouridine(1915)-N(3))-methyltransferase RlmH [Calditrichota bacterium]